jgi:hypothetical protein
MVNAYSWARRGVALRNAPTEPTLEIPISDAEDEELLAASMRDMAFLESEETRLNGD